MKFFVDGKEMMAGVLSVIKALPIRSSMPVLDGILMEARAQEIHLVCSDLMFQKECTIPAEVVSEGGCVVKGKFFAELLRKLPDGEIEFDLEGMILKMNCGRVRQRIQCIEYDEFPLMRTKGESYEIRMEPSACHDMIEQTVFAVSQDDSRPVLTGTLIEVQDDTVSMVATDSFQFAMTTLHCKQSVTDKSTIVQGKVLSEIAKMAEESEEEEIVLQLTQTHISVEVNRSRLTARLLDGKYLDYKRIMPKECKSRVLVETAQLYEIIDRAQLMSREGNNSIILQFEEQQLTIRAESHLGRTEDTIEVQIVGDGFEIAFNPKYCLNVLKNISDEKIYMEFNTPISPCLIRPVQGDRYLYLIVPMRIF